MTPEEKTSAIFATSRKLVIGGRELLLVYPTPRDIYVIDEDMVNIASKDVVNPLHYVHATPDSMLSGQDRLAAISIALDKGAGGGVSPSPYALGRAYNSLAGIRRRIWRLTRKTHPELSEKDIADIVTEENRPDVIEGLESMLRSVDPKEQPPNGGE